MTVTPPTPVVVPGPLTSEWKVLIAGVIASGSALALTLLGNHTHFLTTVDMDAIRNFVAAADAVAISYILSRGVSKMGVSH